MTGKVNHKQFEKAFKSIYKDNNNKEIFTLEIQEPYKGDKYKNKIYIVDRNYKSLEAMFFLKQYEEYLDNKNKINKSKNDKFGNSEDNGSSRK